MYLSLTNTQRRLLQIVFLILVSFCIYKIANDVYTYQTTGILDVSVNSDSAVISVSGPNTNAIVAGTGSASLRLRPGTYLVYSNSDGKHASSVATVTLKQRSTADLDLNAFNLPPSIYDVQFSGMQELVNNGLNVGQITNLKEAFYDFNSKERAVIIETGSVEPGPRNPDTATGFTLKFSVGVDNSSYNATVSYGLGDGIHLTLKDPQTNKTVYSHTMNSQQ